MTVPRCTATWKQGKQGRQKQMWNKPNECVCERKEKKEYFKM